MGGIWSSGNTSSYVGICMRYLTWNDFSLFFIVPSGSKMVWSKSLAHGMVVVHSSITSYSTRDCIQTPSTKLEFSETSIML